ncbi:MAG: M56 family metallopeptidase [Lachnospiraceae bacterium]|nr:M56 family metallopeptidase [Lachnospiraceae bacterium]
MSLAGTISLTFYYFAKLMFRETYSAYWKMALLKISIFFYLCPVQFIKYLLPKDVKVYLPDFFRIHNGNMFYFGQTGYITVHNPFGEYAAYPTWKIIVVLVWIGIVVCFVSHEVIQYFRLKSLIVEFSGKIEPKGRTSREKNSHIEILSSSVFDFPFTIGVIKKIIFIPDVELEDDEFEMIYQHEMTHIRNHDVLTKFLCLMIILLHWFNPLSYLVLHEFNILSEYCCDESIMSMRSKEDRKKYARLLIHFSTERESSSGTVWTKCFLENKNNLERRVGVILDMKRKKSWAIAVMAAASVILGAATVYAYKTEEVIQITDDFVVASDEVLTVYPEEAEFVPVFTVTDTITVTNDGSIYPTYDENLLEPYVLCIHAYEDTVTYAHKTNSSGGCEVRKYHSQRCEKCGKVVVGDWISTTTYAKCPH